MLAFFIFCAAASGHYLINDVLDAEQDRHHPVKRLRPVASGELPAAVAGAAGVALIAASLAGAALLGPWGFVLVVAAYLALTVAYSLWLKRQPVMELALVASGFVLRAVAGGVVAHVYLSNVVPRLHLVRRVVRRHGQALCRARAARREPRGTTAACSTSTPSRSSARR